MICLNQKFYTDGITDEIINKILAIHDKLPKEKYEPIIKDPLKLTNNEKPTKKKMKSLVLTASTQV